MAGLPNACDGIGLTSQVLAEAADLLRNLIKKKLTIATAESCTGGLLAFALTEIPGASAAYLGGVSTYSNAAKEKLINVSGKLLRAEGAVSEAVALAMAHGVQTALKSDIAVAITGVAGPDGGTQEKPVGMVWCCVVFGDKCRAVCWSIAGSRSVIRHKAALQAFKEVWGMVK